jgi:hypothetical protein
MRLFKDRLPLILEKYPESWIVILVPNKGAAWQRKSFYKLMKLSDLSSKWYDVIKDFLEIKDDDDKVNIWSKGGYMASFWDNKSDDILVRMVHVAPKKNTLINLINKVPNVEEMQETPLKPATRKHFGDIIDNIENV